MKPIDHDAGEAHGNRSRTDFAGATARRASRLGGGSQMSSRSNPKRNVPRRIPGENGSMPVSASPPKPPPVLVLYEDLVNPEDLGPAPVYGQYPRGLIAKLLPWLRCARHEILHVCSGSLPPGEGTRVDVRPEAKPDILADGRALPIATGSWRGGILIDPPYNKHYAQTLYGIAYPRPSQLLREAARVAAPDVRIGIVHYITPKPVAGTRLVKALGLSTGFDMPMRAITVYERDGRQLELGSSA